MSSPDPFRRARAALLVALVAVPLAVAGPARGQMPASAEGAASPDSAARAVDALFAEWDRPGSPGAAVAVVRDGRILHAAGYGEAQIEYGIPITPSTVFHVASVSKQFTAFAIHLLAERGELSLDDDVRRWVPEVPDFGRTITLRHLVHHTSGLRDQWTLLQMAGWRLDDVITEEDVLGLLARQRDLNFDPGAEYTYSNTGYTLLAEVVERVTGEPFPAWMEANVFGPLGMERTHFHDDHRMVVPDRAYSYAPADGDGFRKAVLSYANVGATSLFTTVEDLARWIRNFEEPTVGRPETLARMVERGVLAGGDTLSYAAGLIVGEHRGLRTVGHSGGDAGFRSHLIHFPGQRLGVVVLANLGSIDPGDLARRAAEAYLGDALAPAGPSPSAPVAAGGEGRAADGASPADEAALRRVAGHYWDDEAALLRRLSVREGRLVYGRPGADDSALLPRGEGRFVMADVPVRVEVRFEPVEGRPERMVVDVEGEPPVVFVAVDPWTPAVAELRAYAGAYRSDELDRTWEVALVDGALHVRHPRHGDVRLEPAVRDVFSAGEWWLQTVRFTRGADGRVDGLGVSSGRVRDLGFRRVPPP